jgi:hypothetical protein
MAGGPGTPALAGGYKTVDQVERELAEVRSLVSADVPYGLNLFAPPGHGTGAAEVSSYADSSRETQEHGVDLGRPRWDDDNRIGP